MGKKLANNYTVKFQNAITLSDSRLMPSSPETELVVRVLCLLRVARVEARRSTSVYLLDVNGHICLQISTHPCLSLSFRKASTVNMAAGVPCTTT